MGKGIRKDAGIAALLLVLSLLVALPAWGEDDTGGPDSLFYEVQKAEVQGEPQDAGLERVFASPLATRVARENPVVRDDRWVEYSERFYRRRWTVPVLAAALDPIFESRSLRAVSLLAYLALAPLLYLLLRRRFDRLVSAGVAASCAVLPPVLDFAMTSPGTDALGLTLLVAALLVAMLVQERGLRWLPVWGAIVLALSFTRDATIVLVIAVAWVALWDRSRRTLYTLGIGVLASLPAPLLFKAPFKENLAYVFSDFRIPPDQSWGFIAGEYPANLWEVIRYDLEYPLETALAPLAFLVGVALIAGLVRLFFRSPPGDPFFRFHRAAALGAAVTVLISVNYSSLRLELVFIPSVAVGLALLGERAIERYRDRRSPRVGAVEPAR